MCPTRAGLTENEAAGETPVVSFRIAGAGQALCIN
jgi:hypothetical protein